MVNSVTKTTHITATRFKKVSDLLELIRGQKRTSVKIWHRLLGTLRSLAPGLPGGHGIFSVLQSAMPLRDHRVRIGPGVSEVLDLWEKLLDDMEKRPTHLR